MGTMARDDPRARAARALEELRAASVCGHCADDYTTMIDALARDGEFESAMREIVDRHPAASALDTRAAQIGVARDEAYRRAGWPVVADGPARTERPGRPTLDEARSTVRSWRETIGGVVPRPFTFLRPQQRRRA